MKVIGRPHDCILYLVPYRVCDNSNLVAVFLFQIEVVLFSLDFTFFNVVPVSLLTQLL